MYLPFEPAQFFPHRIAVGQRADRRKCTFAAAIDMSELKYQSIQHLVLKRQDFVGGIAFEQEVRHGMVVGGCEWVRDGCRVADHRVIGFVIEAQAGITVEAVSNLFARGCDYSQHPSQGVFDPGRRIHSSCIPRICHQLGPHNLASFQASPNIQTPVFPHSDAP